MSIKPKKTYIKANIKRIDKKEAEGNVFEKKPFNIPPMFELKAKRDTDPERVFPNKVWTAIKKCPYCAEEIKGEAIRCKHCGADLTKPGRNVIGEKIIGWKNIAQELGVSERTAKEYKKSKGLPVKKTEGKVWTCKSELTDWQIKKSMEKSK